MQPELLELIKDIALLLLGAGITALTGVLVHKRDVKEEEKRWQRQLDKEAHEKQTELTMRILGALADAIIASRVDGEDCKDMLARYLDTFDELPLGLDDNGKTQARLIFSEKCIGLSVRLMG